MNPPPLNFEASVSARMAYHYRELVKVQGVLDVCKSDDDTPGAKLEVAKCDARNLVDFFKTLHSEAAELCRKAGVPAAPLEAAGPSIVEGPVNNLYSSRPPMKPGEVWDDETGQVREETAAERQERQRRLEAHAIAHVFAQAVPFMSQVVAFALKDSEFESDESHEKALTDRAARLARKYAESVVAEAKDMQALEMMAGCLH